MASAPAIGTQLVMRLETPNTPGSFGVLASAIGDAGGMVGAVDTRTVGKTTITRDVTVNVPSELVGDQVRQAIEAIDGVRIINVSDSTFLAHLGGKIRTWRIEHSGEDARRSLDRVHAGRRARLARDRRRIPKAYQLDDQAQHRRVITDGTAVLGLGDIGPLRRGAGDGGQVHALQAVRRHRRVSDHARHEGRRRDRRDVQAHRADLRRHQPRRHLAPRCFEVERG
jgi:malate dehydrogenase (oxaloacetate-decarboxylating)